MCTMKYKNEDNTSENTQIVYLNLMYFSYCEKLTPKQMRFSWSWISVSVYQVFALCCE